MLFRLILCLVFLVPTLSIASDAPAECTIGEFKLKLSDFGIDDDYLAPNKSVGNHNPALILDFIKNVIIEEQAYNIQGEKFILNQIDDHLQINAYFSVQNNPYLKPLVFDSQAYSCNSEDNNFTCNSISEDTMAATLKISYKKKHTRGTISIYNDKNILTKHKYSCK